MSVECSASSELMWFGLLLLLLMEFLFVGKRTVVGCPEEDDECDTLPHPPRRTLFDRCLLCLSSLFSSCHDTSANPLMRKSSAVRNNEASCSYVREKMKQKNVGHEWVIDKLIWDWHMSQLSGSVASLTCSTLISPLYMNSIKHLMSSNLQSFMITIVSLSLHPFVSIESKYVLHAHNTTRCAFNVRPSHANVTSQKHPRSSSCENIVCKLLWWYFHRRQYCWSVILWSVYFMQSKKQKKLMNYSIWVVRAATT